jgi:hypothetical protein
MNIQNDAKHLVSILLALIPMLVMYFNAPPFSSYLDVSLTSIPVKMAILAAIIVVITAVACYFICRRHPASVLYAPALAVLSSVWIITGRLPEYWTKNSKLWLLGVALILAMVTGITGALRGDKEKSDQ